MRGSNLWHLQRLQGGPSDAPQAFKLRGVPWHTLCGDESLPILQQKHTETPVVYSKVTKGD